MSEYDNWLFNQASDYWSECTPKPIWTSDEIDYDLDGKMFSYPSYKMNCEECDDESCEYWKEYNM